MERSSIHFKKDVSRYITSIKNYIAQRNCFVGFIGIELGIGLLV